MEPYTIMNENLHQFPVVINFPTSGILVLRII